MPTNTEHLGSAASLSTECLSAILRFLAREDVSKAACVRRQWRSAVDSDEKYWEQQCKDRFALSTPKGFNHKPVSTWRRAFLSWQNELGQHFELGRRACHAWRKIEDFAAAHLPWLLPTLR